MRRLMMLSAFLLFPSVLASAQSMGTLTENGVAMDVKAAVALLDSQDAKLVFFLLPFQPTPAEVAKLQADDYFWVLDKPSPDPKKWKSCPYGRLKLGWSNAKESVGDAKKASSFYIMGQDISAEGNATNVNKLPSEVEFSVVGPVKEGQDVSVTSKGSDTLGKTTLAWDLKLKAKVLAMKN
jgi:hypothetical protein